MSYKTTIQRHRYSKEWEAETYIPIQGGRHLCVSTVKASRGGLRTFAQAMILKKDEGFTSETFIIGQDYNCQVMQFPGVKRVTEKSITEAHTAALAGIEAKILEANEFYAREEQETY